MTFEKEIFSWEQYIDLMKKVTGHSEDFIRENTMQFDKIEHVNKRYLFSAGYLEYFVSVEYRGWMKFYNIAVSLNEEHIYTLTYDYQSDRLTYQLRDLYKEEIWEGIKRFSVEELRSIISNRALED